MDTKGGPGEAAVQAAALSPRTQLAGLGCRQSVLQPKAVQRPSTANHPSDDSQPSKPVNRPTSQQNNQPATNQPTSSPPKHTSSP